MDNTSIPATPVSMDLSTIIESITCPITSDVMTDPVQGNDGQTYERAAIIQALSIKQESPITREPMTVSDLKVNASIRFLCDKYREGAFGVPVDSIVVPKVSSDKILIDHTISRNSENKTMLTFNIDPASMPKLLDGQEPHLSQDVVLVIDHSGSMSMGVEAKDVGGNNLEMGLSIQDIVNHAARTIAKTLDKNSRLGVIIFDNNITTLFDIMLMNERNSSVALAKIGTIKPGGQTNIWHAIEAAVQMLHLREDKTRNGHIMMLTDGIPNISPSRGEIETLQRLRKTLNFTSPIYTFGFGYNLQHGLLYDIAKYATGGNGHIPDGGMIATVFCNFIGTILATVVVNLQLHITYLKDVNFAFMNPIMGDYAYNLDSTDTSNRTVIVDIGTVQIGQTRNIIINSDASRQQFSYFYTYKIGGQSYKSGEVIDFNTLSGEAKLCNSDVNDNIHRYYAVEMLRKIINYKTIENDDEAKTCYLELEKYFNHCSCPGILENLTGQVKLAVNNNTFYKRWGEFYLDQLSRSLNQQIKPNFKDPACSFGGQIFTDLVDKASDVFDTLVPPEPSCINLSNNSTIGYRSLNSGTIHPVQPPPQMSSYNNQDTPCFAGECIVSMNDGTCKMIKDLVKGDLVCTLSNPYNSGSPVVEANVVCVLQTNIIGGNTDLVTFDNGLKVTPWHPIICNGEWVYPNSIKESVGESCDAVYTLVVDGFHTCMINSVWCITLGHGYNMGILKHPYYGTRAVINDLMLLTGWNEGRVVIDNNSIVRDLDTGMVSGINGY
jgi:hypothetical protein